MVTVATATPTMTTPSARGSRPESLSQVSARPGKPKRTTAPHMMMVIATCCLRRLVISFAHVQVHRLLLVAAVGCRWQSGDISEMREAIRRLTSFRIALIGQFIVTVNGMIAAPLQFFADRSFAGAGNAFNQIVSNSHC